MKTILIAYATKTGTTEETAREIASTLEERGFRVEVKPMAQVASLDGWDGVVIGAPVNGMDWLPEAASFVASRKSGLAGTRVAVFFVSYLYFGGRTMWRKAIEKKLAMAAATAGASASVVLGGRLPGPLPGFARILFGKPKDAPLDARDHGVTREWAASLAALFA